MTLIHIALDTKCPNLLVFCLRSEILPLAGSRVEQQVAHHDQQASHMHSYFAQWRGLTIRSATKLNSPYMQ